VNASRVNNKSKLILDMSNVDIHDAPTVNQSFHSGAVSKHLPAEQSHISRPTTVHESRNRDSRQFQGLSMFIRVKESVFAKDALNEMNHFSNGS